MKKEKEDTPVSNVFGKRPLPKAVEIMNEELLRKKFRDQKYGREVYVDRW